ncbi:uncharacterized protein LOC131151158 [Malania oleifera]|uniref:uncharacterized protein LOC131151158 n=1 Tax=Malania oleifera TaxID=397392 RepID=UPI0025AE9250|nr:uncharacterized protein LOC131151158 [Malania oleifera]
MREIERSVIRLESSPTDVGCTIDRFTRMHPPTFVGGLNPFIEEDWVEKTERILEVLHYTNRQRVLYATFQLSGEAGRWWIAVTLLEKQRASPSSMMWGRVKEGTLTVQRYAARYIDLSQFAPYMVPNEYKKAQRFERGLRKDIRRLLGMLQIREFSVLIDKATIVETDLQGDEVVQEHRKRPVSSGSQTGPRQGQWKKNKNYSSGYRVLNSG